jgi:hypothetical protein
MILKVEFGYFYQAFFMDVQIRKSPKSNQEGTKTKSPSNFKFNRIIL